VATFAAAVVILAFAAGYYGAHWGTPSSSSASTPQSPGPSYLYLTISLHPITGWPQYTPVNFTVIQGEVIVTIIDYDSPAAWPGCDCTVTGTTGNVKEVNGTPMNMVPASNLAHPFTISAPGMGVQMNVLSPGMSTVTFPTWLNQTGSFGWFCIAPCGAGSNPYTSPPMGTFYMTGTLTVV
jgi:hypothetical protein